MIRRLLDQDRRLDEEMGTMEEGSIEVVDLAT